MTAGNGWDQPLAALIWHWGQAYLITNPEP